MGSSPLEDKAGRPTAALLIKNCRNVACNVSPLKTSHSDTRSTNSQRQLAGLLPKPTKEAK